MPSPYARTLLQVIDDALRLCNDYQSSGSDGWAFTWSEARRCTQDMLLEMVRRTGVLKDSRVIFLQEDVQVYDLPPECIRILRVGINNRTGTVLVPTSIAERDYEALARSSEGEPNRFYRDHTLAPNQVGFIPTPGRDGSSFTRDTDYGLLRRIVGEDGGALPFDANLALRRVSGIPFSRSGSGRIIRELISLYGNAYVTYVRAPEKWDRPQTYPDPDLPTYIHKDMKYGTAERLLRGSKSRAHQFKQKLFSVIWEGVILTMQRLSEHQGPNAGAKPL